MGIDYRMNFDFCFNYSIFLQVLQNFVDFLSLGILGKAFTI